MPSWVHKYLVKLSSLLPLPLLTASFLSRRSFLMETSPICCNRLCKKVLKMQTNAQWDHELGAWKGRAPSLHIDEYKSPLYVFGYGSLIWRPGDFLSQFQSFPAAAMKCKRLFAQKSLDHRGNSKFPGLVLNLVKDDDLERKGYKLEEDDQKSFTYHGHQKEEDCYGLVWLVPDDKIPAVLDYLDDREKGGYSRHYIHVKLMQETPHYPAKAVIDAVVYTGLEDNPNFFLPTLTGTTPKHSFSYMQDRTIAADIITGAKGLSGTNVEYLLKLQRYLEERNMSDTYINNLAAAVRMRLGTWRRKAIINSILAAIPSNIRRAINTDARPLQLIGCGSNEYRQLDGENIDIVASPKDISQRIKEVFVDMPGFSHVEWIDAERHTVLAAGANSAYLYEGRLAVWGSIVKTLFKAAGEDSPSSDVIVIDGVEAAALGYDTLMLLLPTGWVVSLGFPYKNSPTSFVLPKEAFQLKRKEEAPTMQPFADDVGGLDRLKSPTSLAKARFEVELKVDEFLFYKPSFQIVKISLGMNIAAAITNCGGLMVWGTPNSGEIFDVDVPWYPPPPTDDFFAKNSTDCSSTSNAHLSKCIDVACGNYHVVVVDDEGRVFTHADPKHLKKVQEMGALGDSLPLRREDSDYASRDCLFTQQIPPRMSISEGAASSFPRSTSWTSFTCPNTGTSTPTGSSSGCYTQKHRLVPSALCMYQVLLPPDIRFLRATVGCSHTIVRGLKRCGEVVCYAWGRQDMSQYQVIDQATASLLIDDPSPSTVVVPYDCTRNVVVPPTQESSETASLASDDALSMTSMLSQATSTDVSTVTSATTSPIYPHPTVVGSKPVVASALSMALQNNTPSTTIKQAALSALEGGNDQPTTTIKTNPASSRWHRPRQLLPLPMNRSFAEVWCGSEYTLAMDAETSSLWGMGWNDHFNLGGSADSSSTEESPTEDDPRFKSTNVVSSWILLGSPSTKTASNEQNEEVVGFQVPVFDGSVACGGAHILLLQRPAPRLPSTDLWSSYCI